MGKTEGKKLLGEFTGHAKETAKKVTKNIIQRIDQNDDGKFDMSDVAKIKETTAETAQKVCRRRKMAYRQSLKMCRTKGKCGKLRRWHRYFQKIWKM